MKPDEPEKEEQETEEPDNRQGNATETGTIGQPIMLEKERNGQATVTGIIELPGIPEEEDNWQTAETGTVEHQIILEKEPTVRPLRNVSDGMPGSDKVRPNATETPKEPGKKRPTKKKPPIAHPVTEVYRKTEMPGMSAKSFPENPAQIRRRTERDLKNPEFGIPYSATEKAVRDLACSLMEREDRIHGGMLLDINCMQQDIGMLKDQVYTMKIVKSGSTTGEKK